MVDPGREEKRRLSPMLVVLGVAAFVVIVVFAGFALLALLVNGVGPQCDPSSGDRTLMEQIPFDEFTGAAMISPPARCETSPPYRFGVDARLAEGEKIDPGWFELETAGVWEATYRYVSDRGHQWACYRSPAANADVMVYSDGRVSASIYDRNDPCDYRGADGDVDGVSCVRTSNSLAPTCSGP